MAQALAIKYRPTRFEDLTEQGAVVTILTNQIETATIKHGYLFCGGAGTGKTTSARIFASMINGSKGVPIELDAASNNSVDDIRKLCEDAQTQAIDCDFKVFILDEVHVLSSQAWQALLKTLEEPPSKSIFILCTTNPEKIPQTILSRVQRYNFQRISQEGIVSRLRYILDAEHKLPGGEKIVWYDDALEYIAKIADGGMRDAITLMDKCLSFSTTLSLFNVVKALGVANYADMFELNDAVFMRNAKDIINKVSEIYKSGMDLKLFIRTYFEFILDLNIYRITSSLDNTKIPQNWVEKITTYHEHEWDVVDRLLEFTCELNHDIKWEQNTKELIIAKFILFLSKED